MFGEMTEVVVRLRMEDIRAETAHAQLVKLALEGQRPAGFRTWQNRTLQLSGLVLRWWETLIQHRQLRTLFCLWTVRSEDRRVQSDPGAAVRSRSAHQLNTLRIFAASSSGVKGF